MNGNSVEKQPRGIGELTVFNGVALGVSIGIALGVPLGALCGQVAIGTALGIALGAIALLTFRGSWLRRRQGGS
jgi:hypothetical protein